MKLGEIAELLSCSLMGDGKIEITGVATLESAQTGEISFLANIKYYTAARKTRAAAIIVGPDHPSLAASLLINENPYLTFAKAIELFHKPPQSEPHIHPTAWISDAATVGQGVTIGAYAYIDKNVTIEDDVKIHSHCSVLEGATIGEKTVIHSGCVIRERVAVGRRCALHSNTVVGADGFGYAKQANGEWYKIYQAGTVVIEDDVEIGACVTIDRAALGETRIGRGTKVDNLVQIGHGCSIGENSLICAQVGLAGTTKVGNQVVLAGQVGAAGHLTIGDGAIATPQTGIPASVEPGAVISGSPAMEHRKWLKYSAVSARLPEIQKSVRDLEKRVARLEETSKVILQESINSL